MTVHRTMALTDSYADHAMTRIALNAKQTSIFAKNAVGLHLPTNTDCANSATIMGSVRNVPKTRYAWIALLGTD